MATSTSLTRFVVKGLFGLTDVEIPIEDNSLVIVGENGSGKSTIISLLYYCLTGQWELLVEQPCRAIELTINGNRKKFTIAQLAEELQHDEPGSSVSVWRYIERTAGRSSALRLRRTLRSRPRSYWLQNEELLLHVAEEFAIPRAALQDAVMSSKTRQAELFPRLEAAFGAQIPEQVLFLPTYRRIERDLQTIFPQLRAEKGLRDFHRQRDTGPGYIELVEFGMRDVEEAIAQTMRRLDQEFRADLNRLTGEYLRTVIRGEYKDSGMEPLMEESAIRTAEDVLSRIDDKILPSSDRFGLRKLVLRIHKTREVKSDERVVAHFLTKLFEIHKSQHRREEGVRKLVEICNQYLGGKRMVFDRTQFELAVFRTKGKEANAEKIPLNGLSSGEKQIVSLFAHLFLSGAEGYFVLVDEPELSISVPWQRRLLVDLRATGLLSGVVAVTHSPFIFENEFADYARSMDQLSKPVA